MPSVAAILPAAGRAVRFGRDKLLEPLAGVSVLRRAVRAVRCDAIARIIVATDDPARRDELSREPGVEFVAGGGCRAESVRNALRHCAGQVDFVAIHDAARPLLSPALRDRLIAYALLHGSAVPAVAVKLTIKRADATLPARVIETVPRAGLFEMQTPQVVAATDLLDAFDRCTLPLESITDDAQLLELIGRRVWLVDGEETNLKITTPTDLRLAGLLLDSTSPPD